MNDNYIRLLPKTELHLHLEGSVTPALLQELARKYASDLSDCTLAELRRTFFTYSDFHQFLQTYKAVCEHLRAPDDYERVWRDLESYLQRQNVLYAEVIYTPSIPWRFNRDGEAVLTRLLERSAAFEHSSGIRVRWILDCVRQFDLSLAKRTAELAAAYRHRGVVAVGLGGDEKAAPLGDFVPVMNWARAHELFVHVHAGEIRGPEEVWEAVRQVGANRIGHGIQAARDASLMVYLREHAIGLDICLTSNIKTRAWPLLSDHPFPLLFKRGVHVNLSTDDPGLFETDLELEYKKAAGAFGLTAEQLRRLVLQGVRAAFLGRDEKMQLMRVFQEKIHQLSPPSSEP